MLFQTIIPYLTLNTIIEIICLIVAIVCLRRDVRIEWRLMIVFLFITCVSELMGIHVKRHYLEDRVHNYPNIWIYNILLIFQISFIHLMFYYLFKKYANSRPRIITGPAILAVLCMLGLSYGYELFSHGVFEYNNFTNTVISVLFVFYSLYYYFLLINDDGFVNLKYSPEFWWVAGILFFYFGRTACNIFYLKLSAIVITPNHYLTYYIYNTLNVILYGCWAYSFICKKWQTTNLKTRY